MFCICAKRANKTALANYKTTITKEKRKKKQT